MHFSVKLFAIALAGLIPLTSALALNDQQREHLATQLEQQCQASISQAAKDQGQKAPDSEGICQCLSQRLAAEITEKDIEALTQGEVPDGYKKKTAEITMSCMSDNGSSSN